MKTKKNPATANQTNPEMTRSIFVKNDQKCRFLEGALFLGSNLNGSVSPKRSDPEVSNLTIVLSHQPDCLLPPIWQSSIKFAKWT